ncbi:lasso peptide biosynthesis B2 protein [Paenibacillus sp. BR2-3]|uniref:lasso peptide biosynthesis B2 protein n=1 Tax=Paenibacillus sp. BR2-3 TaxID=3048494 RepID=UPI003977D0AC
MRAIRRIRLLLTFDKTTVLLFAEAFLMLGWARIMMLFKFAKIAPTLGLKSRETAEDYRKDDIRPIKNITSAIHVVSRYTPWDSKCLVRAIAGMKMLERRRINSTLYLGTAKDENGRMIAHAWLRSGPFYISGADVMNRFVIVEKFAKEVLTD